MSAALSKLILFCKRAANKGVQLVYCPFGNSFSAVVTCCGVKKQKTKNTQKKPINAHVSVNKNKHARV